MRLDLGVIFLYNVLRRGTRVSRKNDIDIIANFETRSTIDPLIEHLQLHVPGLSGLNIATDGWEERVHGEKVFNYTYGFGLLKDSAYPTFILEAASAEYYGATPSGIYLSANKPHAAELMSSLGFLCPRQRIVSRPPSSSEAAEICSYFKKSEYLVLKPAYEESSVGLRLLVNDPDDVRSSVASLYRWRPGVFVIQEYVDGVDVTVPVVGRSDGHCLPAVALQHEAESSEPFIFDAVLKASKPRLHYAPIGDWPREQRETLYDMALNAFAITEQRDYARLDCRVSPDGRCWFLEMNANPQLSLGKGSIAVSADAIGLAVGEVVQSIINDQSPDYGASPLEIGL
jgi:D-alanine-D-alanine ligase